MNLSQLREYNGSSPKPGDFEQFWKRALRDLDAQPLDYELGKRSLSVNLRNVFICILPMLAVQESIANM